MVEKVLLLVITAIISALITYFITSLAGNSSSKKQIKEAIENHEKLWHQDSMYKYVDIQLKEHVSSCGIEGVKDELSAMRSALIFLVLKQGGNPKDFNLLKEV